jgi:hypothetical protein
MNFLRAAFAFSVVIVASPRTFGQEATERVSLDSAEVEGSSLSVSPSISADGRFVSFQSDADNLVPGDTNFETDVFVHGPCLTLEADPESASAGALLTLTTWSGDPTGLAMLVVVAVNGTGAWDLAGTVPTGLAGTAITLESFGIIPTGKVGTSNREGVTFP